MKTTVFLFLIQKKYISLRTIGPRSATLAKGEHLSLQCSQFYVAHLLKITLPPAAVTLTSIVSVFFLYG